MKSCSHWGMFEANPAPSPQEWTDTPWGYILWL